MSANFNTSESGSINFIYDDDEQVDGQKVREAYLKRQLERPNKIHEALKYLVEPGTVTELRAFEGVRQPLDQKVGLSFWSPTNDLAVRVSGFL